MTIKAHQILYSRLLFLILVTVSSCGMQEETPSSMTGECGKTPAIHADSLYLDRSKGLVFYRSEVFSGTALNYGAEGQISQRSQYCNGKKHGSTTLYYADCLPSQTLSYEHGKKDGYSYSWWPSGTLRSAHQDSAGIGHGTQIQWYESGAIFKKISLQNGRESGLQQSWRENGKIYNNYVVKNNKIYGLKRSTLCYQLEDEELSIAQK